MAVRCRPLLANERAQGEKRQIARLQRQARRSMGTGPDLAQARSELEAQVRRDFLGAMAHAM